MLRLGVRIESFITFLLDYAAHRTHPLLRLRDTPPVHEDVAAFLKTKRAEIRDILESRFQVRGRAGMLTRRIWRPLRQQHPVGGFFRVC